MSRYMVICHRCGKSTFVDLSKTISDQRCRACKGFLQGVDVSVGQKQEVRRKLVVKVAGSSGQEPEWQDQEVPIVPIRQRWPWRFKWIVITGLVAFLVLVARVAYVRITESGSASRSEKQQAAPVEVDIRTTEAWRIRATSLAKKALASQTADELLPLLYHPEVSDDVIRSYYNSEEKLPLGSDLVPEYFIPADDYKSPDKVVVFDFSDPAGRRRNLVVLEKADGSMKIDWPCLVGRGEMSMKDYLRTQPAGPVVMRARARVAHYFNDYFGDSRKWLCIRLSDVTDETVINGYMDLEFPGVRDVAAKLSDPESGRIGPDKPVIVVLKYPKGNLRAEQTEILSVIMNWYNEEGLQPLIDHARKLDSIRSENKTKDGALDASRPAAPENGPAPAPNGETKNPAN